jgi:sugar lactone lactonase YvrE
VNGSDGVAFDRDGDLYVANYQDSRIVKYDSTGTPSVFADSSAGLFHPNALAFDASGNLFVSNFGDPNDFSTNTIVKLDSACHGTTFATNDNDDTILKFDSNGNWIVVNTFTI